MNLKQVITRLKDNSDPKALEAMARFGITPKKSFGVKVPVMRQLAKEIGRDHDLALRLWAKDTREMRIVASMIGEPKRVTKKLMEDWVKEFDYWEICDQVIMNLFEKTPFAWSKAVEWSKRNAEYEKRAGFVLMARLAVSDKKAEDKEFERLLPIIKKGSTDDRNMVKKGVNWALRQIGKRNLALNKKAVNVGEEIKKMDSRAARWVASDALKELKSEAVQSRLRKKSKGTKRTEKDGKE